jgi:diguanylate cyclase (GGDEF)-like protein/PAS domain S-box-containing protein
VATVVGPSGCFGRGAVEPRLRQVDAAQVKRAGDGGAAGEVFYRGLIDQMSEGVYFVDRRRKITYWSAGAERLTGFRQGDVEGLRCGEGMLNHIDDEGAPLCGSRCPLMATIRDGQVREAHVHLRHADGHRRPVWVRASPVYVEGRIAGAVETFGDDSATHEARAELSSLRQAALRDPLTGLGNRRHLEQQLASWLSDWTRQGDDFGVLFADIDHFKKINDTYGHAAGDEALGIVGRTIAHATKAGDVATRCGGEEFVVLVSGDAQGVLASAERLRTLVAASRLVVGRELVEMTISL